MDKDKLQVSRFYVVQVVPIFVVCFGNIIGVEMTCENYFQFYFHKILLNLFEVFQ